MTWLQVPEHQCAQDYMRHRRKCFDDVVFQCLVSTTSISIFAWCTFPHLSNFGIIPQTFKLILSMLISHWFISHQTTTMNQCLLDVRLQFLILCCLMNRARSWKGEMSVRSLLNILLATRWIHFVKMDQLLRVCSDVDSTFNSGHMHLQHIHKYIPRHIILKISHHILMLRTCPLVTLMCFSIQTYWCIVL